MIRNNILCIVFKPGFGTGVAEGLEGFAESLDCGGVVAGGY